MNAEREAGCKQQEDVPASRDHPGSVADLGIRSHAVAVDIVGDVGSLQIVDLGCGEGHFGRELAKRGARVTGIDPLIASSDQQKYGTGSLQILQGSAEAVPLSANSVDLVTFIYSLHHMSEAGLAVCLREATRPRTGGSTTTTSTRSRTRPSSRVSMNSLRKMAETSISRCW